MSFVVVVTGGGSGIGAAIAKRLAKDKNVFVVVSDVNLSLASAVAKEIGGRAVSCDVGVESDVRKLVADTVEKHGRIDFFVSNAGIHLRGMGADGLDRHTTAGSFLLYLLLLFFKKSNKKKEWERIWRINVLAHVWAFKACLPHFRKQKSGRFLVTASAAGLLSQIGDASYSTTKHAAVGLAENMAISHGDENIRVHCLCPQAVDTAMNSGTGKQVNKKLCSVFRKSNCIIFPENKNPAISDGVLTPDQVAECVVEAVANEKFLILPHPKVLQYLRGKAQDYDKWLGGMRKWRRSML
jgi:NAD(P)-dependent dehydrogenase (short-subunit alcohol dehydrogenase family)